MAETIIPLLVLHDFDVAGFMIFGTLQRDTRRYQFSNAIELIDLGLRLEDIDGLERNLPRRPRPTLRSAATIGQNGATPEEIDSCSTSASS